MGDLDIVHATASQAVELVDDDEVDRVVAEIFEHALQFRTVGGPSRGAAVDEFFDNDCPETGGLTFIRFALRGDREAFLIATTSSGLIPG